MKTSYKLLVILASILSIGSIQSMDVPEVHVTEARGFADGTRIDHMNVHGGIAVTIPHDVNIHRTTHIHNNPDFTGGDPNATFWQKIRNAARDSVPSLVYGLPSEARHIAASVVTNIITSQIMEYIRRRQEPDAERIAHIDGLVRLFAAKMAQLSPSSAEYTRYKQQVETLRAKQAELEARCMQRMYEDVAGESLTSRGLRCLGSALHIQSTKNNLRHIGQKLVAPVAG